MTNKMILRNQKGISILIVGIVLMLLVSVVGALFFFGQNIIIEKRSLQEKILREGNRLEMMGKMIQMSGDLTTLQTIKDIGQSSIVKTSSIQFNPTEKLPYWDNVPRSEIEGNVAELSRSYFENYVDGYKEFFNDRRRVEYWAKFPLDWKRDSSLGVFENEQVSIDFGSVRITYSESPVTISKEFPIESDLKTSFGEILGVSQAIIDALKIGVQEEYVCCIPLASTSAIWELKDACLGFESDQTACNPDNCNDACIGQGAESGSWDSSTKICTCKFSLTIDSVIPTVILERIETQFENERIEVELEDRGDYIYVFAREKERYFLYSPVTDSKQEDYIGVKFLIDKGNGERALVDDLDKTVKCSNGFVIMSENDICPIISLS